MDEKGLLQLKDKIAQAKAKASEIQGQREYLIKELKNQWNCKNIEEATSKIEQMANEVERLDKQIKEGISTIQEKMEKSEEKK